MRTMFVGLAALAAVAVATPAGAQDRDWRHDGWRHHHRAPHVTISAGRSYARECTVRRSKTVRGNGTVVVRRSRVCD